MAYSDCWSDVLRSTYYTSLVLFHDYRKGVYTPGLDRFARPVTLNLNVWQSGVPGKALATRAAGTQLNVADGGTTPELELTTAGTLVFCLRPGGWPFTAGTCFCYKVTGAAGYLLVCNDTSRLYLTTGGVNALESASTPLAPCVSIAVSWTNGVAPRFYGNGVFRSVGNNAANASAETSTLYLMQVGGNFLLPPPVQSVMFFNTQLTGAEISQLHNDFEQSAHVL